MTVHFRVAKISDSEAIADVYFRSRTELVSCAPLVHSQDEVRNWVGRYLIPAGRTTVAIDHSLVVGFLTIFSHSDFNWVEQLYVDPTRVAQGIGTGLLAIARSKMLPPIRLYTFQCNQRARYFYERHGFKAIDFSDGSENEEKCPDILYEWREDDSHTTACQAVHANRYE